MFESADSPAAGGRPASSGEGALAAPSGGDRMLRCASLGRIERELTTLAAHISAGTCRWLELVGEFDRREGWANTGCKSCAEWISWQCGMDSRAAREHVRVARRLRELPRIRAAFGRGELTYSKTRALVRIADETSEETLLEVATHATAAQLERIVAGMRRVSTAQARAVHEERYASWWWEDDGSLSLRARLPPEEGAQVVAALEAAREALRDDAATDPPASTRTDKSGDSHGSAEPLESDPAGHPKSPSDDPDPERSTGGSAEPRDAEPRAVVDVECATTTNADALAAVAESFLATGPRPRSGGERYQLVVDVDIGALTADQTGSSQSANTSTASSDASTRADPNDAAAPTSSPGHAALRDGPAIARETARRLGCDASMVAMLTDDGGALSVGRKTRSIPPALRRALQARDGGCRFPGCERRRFVDAHHIEHWAHGGATDLDNLVTLCRHHHRLVHEGGFAIEVARDGELTFRAPSGTILREVPRPRPGTERYLRATTQSGPLHPGSGEPMNLNTVVDGVVHELELRQRRAGEAGSSGSH